MKNNKLLMLAVALTALSACSSSPSTSSFSSASTTSASASGENQYLFYTLKQGQTKDGLSGSPWLNPTQVGIVSKIEKPSEKDDFFIATNYDYLSTATLQEGQVADGGSMSAINKLQENFSSLANGSANKGNFAAPVKKAIGLYQNNDKSQAIASVKSFISQIKAITNKASLFSFISTSEAAPT